MVDSRVYVFNQYYLDLLKRVKNSAKKFKEKSKSAKNVLTSVKSNYSTFDKTEITNIEFVNENVPDEFWKEIIDKERINSILKKIKGKSKKLNIDHKITNRIWKNMIWSYIDYEKRNFKKK